MVVSPVVKLRFPLKMAEPVNAGRDKLAALNAALAVTLLAELIVTVVSGVAPTTPEKRIFPTPAVNPKLCAPRRVPEKVISPPALFTTIPGAVKVVLARYITASAVVVTLAPVEMELPPKETAPPERIVPAELIVKAPVGLIVTPFAVIVLLIFAAPVIVALKEPPV